MQGNYGKGIVLCIFVALELSISSGKSVSINSERVKSRNKRQIESKTFNIDLLKVF